MNTDCRKIPVKPFLLGFSPSWLLIPVTRRNWNSETTEQEISVLSGSSSNESELPCSFSYTLHAALFLHILSSCPKPAGL